MTERKKLSDILSGSEVESLQQIFDAAPILPDYAALPAGQYDAVIVAGELFTAKTKGTRGYKLTLEISSGEHKGRKIWHDIWLTALAIGTPGKPGPSKRELTKIGVTHLSQLDRPLPARFQCKVKLALRKNDDGIEYNRVVSFECVGVEKADPFAPHTERNEGDGAAVDAGENDGHGDAYEPPTSNEHREELFPPIANSPAKNGVCPTPYDRGQRR